MSGVKPAADDGNAASFAASLHSDSAGKPCPRNENLPMHTLALDTIIDRRGTGCLKYDFAVQRGKPADVLPFWVADMDSAWPSPSHAHFMPA